MTNIIYTPEFVKNLDKWLFLNEQKYANYFKVNSAKIPGVFRQYTQPLYRGMTVDDEFITKTSSEGIVFQAHSSWSKKQDIAKKFVSDSKYNISQTGNVKIMIKKIMKPSDILLDIHSLVVFMGGGELEMLGMDEMSLDSALNEHEVLIEKGIKITKKDITLLK